MCIYIYPGNELERALRKIGREDVIKKCMYNVEAVTDISEQQAAWEELNQPGTVKNYSLLVMIIWRNWQN